MSTRHPLTIPDEWILRDDDGSYWCRGLGSPWWVNTPKGGRPSPRTNPEGHDDLDTGDHRAMLVFVAVTALVHPRSGRPVAEPSPG